MHGGVYQVVVSKLSYSQPVIQVILMLVDEEPKEFLNFLVDSQFDHPSGGDKPWRPLLISSKVDLRNV